MSAVHGTPAIRVAVFNDSATMRAVIRSVLTRQGDFQVVAEAADGLQAGEICRAAAAELVLMDIVMPLCNGYEATRNIMEVFPLPIVMVSSVVGTTSADVLFEAMKAGALFVAEAPPVGTGPQVQLRQDVFVQTILNVARGVRGAPGDTDRGLGDMTPSARAVDAIGICASAGGPSAVTEVLASLPAAEMPPILLVQHLAPGFSHTFARWLSSESGSLVEVAEASVPLRRGVVYLAADDHHLVYGEGGVVRLTQTPPVGSFRPSATVLLESLCVLRNRALGVILSGMGDDGAAGAVALRQAGAQVVVQDRSSCAVYGMPRAALKLGGADDVLDPGQIARWLIRKCGVSP